MPRFTRLFAFATLALPAAALAATSKPRLLNVQELITSEDYPSVAARNGQEGAVDVKVKVDSDGLVTSCTIKTSSGHSALDEQTCALFRARARFAPARDRRGRAIESSFEKRVVWRLEGDSEPPLPRQAWVIKSTIAMNERGEPVDCTAEVTGLPAEITPCPDSRRHAAAAAAASVGAEGASVDFIVETYFVPVEAARAVVPPDRPEGTKIGQQVSEITIEADGRVSQCLGMSYSGGADPSRDLCDDVNWVRFSPAAGTSPIRGTLITRAYLRKRSVA